MSTVLKFAATLLVAAGIPFVLGSLLDNTNPALRDDCDRETAGEEGVDAVALSPVE